MRLGKIKNIIDKVINDENQITISHDAIFGGQAYMLNDFQEISNVYDVINKLKWNDVDNSQINPVIKKYRDDLNPVQLEQAEFNILNSYISSVNQKLPFYYSILETMVDKQDEKIINIKLPEEVYSFKKLTELNDRFQKTLDLFNIDGEFVFKNFDKGSDWYVVFTQGILTSTFFIACLKVAQEIMKLRTEYFKSEQAHISFEVSKRTKKDLTRQNFEKYWMEEFLDSKIKETIKEIGETNGATQHEIHSKLLKGTIKLVKELGEGTEFHLSLNPPNYATEINGGLIIDYKKIRQLRMEEAKKLGKDEKKILANPNNIEKSKSDKLEKK